MSRENRFSDTSSNFSSRRRLSVEKVKEIFIQNVTNGDKRSLNIVMKKTVKDLKKEIEKLFGLFLESSNKFNYWSKINTSGR